FRDGFADEYAFFHAEKGVLSASENSLPHCSRSTSHLRCNIPFICGCIANPALKSERLVCRGQNGFEMDGGNLDSLFSLVAIELITITDRWILNRVVNPAPHLLEEILILRCQPDFMFLAELHLRSWFADGLGRNDADTFA